jgi:hypothetical protein
MLAKLTSKNQITLPKSVVGEFPQAEYFEVEAQGGRIVLTPVRIGRADAVREKLASLGIREADVGAAVKWARRRRK